MRFRLLRFCGDPFADHGGSQDQGRPDPSGQAERLAQKDRGTDHRDHRFQIAQDRNRLNGEHRDAVEVEAVGDSGMQNAQHQDDEPGAQIGRKRDPASAADQHIGKDRKRRKEQLDAGPVRVGDAAHLAVAEHQNGEADGTQQSVEDALRISDFSDSFSAGATAFTGAAFLTGAAFPSGASLLTDVASLAGAFPELRLLQNRSSLSASSRYAS